MYMYVHGIFSYDGGRTKFSKFWHFISFPAVALECEENTLEETTEATIPFDSKVKTFNGNFEAYSKNSIYFFLLCIMYVSVRG